MNEVQRCYAVALAGWETILEAINNAKANNQEYVSLSKQCTRELFNTDYELFHELSFKMIEIETTIENQFDKWTMLDLKNKAEELLIEACASHILLLPQAPEPVKDMFRRDLMALPADLKTQLLDICMRMQFELPDEPAIGQQITDTEAINNQPVTWEIASQYVHDASGLSDTEKTTCKWEQKKGIYYPIM